MLNKNKRLPVGNQLMMDFLAFFIILYLYLLNILFKFCKTLIVTTSIILNLTLIKMVLHAVYIF